MAYRWLQRAKHARIGLKYLRRQAEAIDRLSPGLSDLTDAQLNDHVQQLRQTFARRDYGPHQVRQALAVIREAAQREVGQKPYLVQLMGALGMFHGQIVEMVTGEGKTLTAAVAAALLGWTRRPVHVITVNDYLSQRDADGNRALFGRCGLEVAAVVSETSHNQRGTEYMKPIVYTTPKELIADWLRDQLRLGRLTEPVSARWMLDADDRDRQGPTVLVPGLHVALIDELDAVLIDEAVTPLIIAQPRGQDPQAALYQRARALGEHLVRQEHYEIDRSRRQATLTDIGQRQIERLVSQDDHALWQAARRREEMVEQALVAECCYHPGQHYQIVEDQVVIVDEYTGRFMHDRQWQHGLHQAVEAKHRVPITADRDTLASMSFQRFFRHYPHLCGMTGTAADARTELETTYGLPVRVIPTHRPLVRRQLADQIFTSTSAKWQAVVDEVLEMHKFGRPVLIGTRSIEASEMLGGLLRAKQLKPQVLNAVQHKEEAAIVARAGEPGAITVATNMAGRGTDIELGRGVVQRSGVGGERRSRPLRHRVGDLELHRLARGAVRYRGAASYVWPGEPPRSDGAVLDAGQAGPDVPDRRRLRPRA